MIIRSFDVSPLDGETIHQIIDQPVGIFCGMGGEVRIFSSGQDTAVAQDFLDLQQVKAGLDQMGRVAVAQAVRSNLFFIPHSWATFRSVT